MIQRLLWFLRGPVLGEREWRARYSDLQDRHLALQQQYEELLLRSEMGHAVSRLEHLALMEKHRDLQDKHIACLQELIATHQKLIPLSAALLRLRGGAQ